MRIGIYFVMAVFLVLITSILLPYTAHAVTQEDLKAQIAQKNKDIQALEEEMKQYQQGVATTSATARTLQGEINRINQEIKNLTYQLRLTQTKISKKDLEIKDLGAAITQTVGELAHEEQALAETIRELDHVERQSAVEIFLHYRALTAFFDTIEKNKTLESNLRSLYDELSKTKKSLETQKVNAQKAHTELLNLKNDLDDQRSLEQEEQGEKKKLLTTTKNQEARYQALLRDREKRRSDIEREMQSIEDELRRLIDPSSVPAVGKGILLWPIENPQITQTFGMTSFSQSTDAYKNGVHNGVDFRARVGTPVLAAEVGTVKDVGDTDTICRGGSYGKYIVIDHPNNLSTLYGHLSRVKVTPGQQITRGEIVALSGNTGYSTGPHLHFTVYASNTFRRAQTVHCSLVPAGGYLNPLDYL